IPEFALRKTGADIVTVGEAELTMIALMKVFAGKMNIEDVQGICYLRDGEFFDNGKPILPRQVTKTEVGWPDREVYPLEKYITCNKFYPFDQNARMLTLVTGRGCPYACNFCYRSSAYRIRPATDILDELEYLIERYRLDGFYIVDDLVMLSERKIRDFYEGILDRGLEVQYNCTGRVNTVTPEILKLLRESGCVSIYYGFESGNQTVLETMSKKTNLAGC
ncbi:MAG: radical SAM protein, partial [Alphaproteobacteria bacterium]|nr:radical SAM protein [Alphaproteobacteria bacterium]